MRAAVAFTYEHQTYYGVLDDRKQITIGSSDYDALRVEGLFPTQFILTQKEGRFFLSGKKPYEVNNLPLQPDQLIPMSRKHGMILYISSSVGQAAQSFPLPQDGVVTLGRAPQNIITVGMGFLSREHMQFVCRDGMVKVCDTKSTNGTYVNGKRVREKSLYPGDVVSVFTFRITYRGGALIFENCADRIHMQLPAQEDESLYKQEVACGIRFQRSPRIQSQLPTDPIVLATPPNRGPQYQERRGRFMQLLSTGSMFAASMLMGAASPVFMVARAASLLMPLANMAMQKKSDQARKAQLEEYERLRKELYGQYIEQQKQRIEEVASTQRHILQEENPSVEACLQMALACKRNLWERTGRDRDFLDVRLGMGYDELCVPVKSNINENGFQMEQDEMRQLAAEIVEETRYVDQIPTRLHLRKYHALGMIGEREKVRYEIRNLLICLCATHYHKDVKIVGIFDESERDFWEPVKWLPHTWDDEKQSRFLAFNAKEAAVLCERMNDMLESRKRNLSDSAYKNDPSPLPHYVFVIGSKRYVQDKLMMPNLLLNRDEMGISSIFLFDEMRYLPKECEFILDLSDPDGKGKYGSGYERDKMNQKYLFDPDPAVDTETFDRFARTMSAIEVDEFARKSDIPDSITFLQGYGVRSVEELEAEKRWMTAREEETLAAPIGMMAGGRVFSLDAYEKGHGPHGLVAGTTGSGKSELVQSWILSMAVNYHPQDVAFVLIDYKGGGMAGHFDKLPHVIGEITNIGSGIDRAFISLESENVRREAIFRRYGVDNLKKYHKLYRAGEADEVLPHLIIVVDEFAMLKKEKPDSISRLIKIATVGRSLGVHLLLATQNPSGVVDDQIQKNTNFRLCLKVQSAADSREVIGTPDASNLRSAGRAYVRVGNGEFYEMFQSFWSGAPYYGANAHQEDAVNRVRIVTTDGTRIQAAQRDRTRLQSDMDEMSVVVQYLAKTAEKLGVRRVKSLWLPELPVYLTLEELGMPARYDSTGWQGTEDWLRVPIGRFDHPAKQMQGVQLIDFAADGHLGIYGSPQTGKSNLLKTILYSAGRQFTPEEVEIYGIDCGGGGTTVFSKMPHVGCIARDSETEKIQKLEALMRRKITERKRAFLKHTVPSLEDYRQAVGKDIPAVLFVVDNLPALLELYPDLEDFLVLIAREGAAYGIYLIYTANSSAGVKFKIQQNIKNALAFELNDRGDYPGLVGHLQGQSLPPVRGRAFIKGTPPLVVQTALPAEGENEWQRSQALQKVLESMDACWTGARPEEVPVMPEVITMSQMLDLYREKNQIPIGIAYETIAPVYLNLSEQYVFTVSGGIGSGKSRVLENLAAMLHAKDEENELYVFDGPKRSMRECESYAKAYGQVSDNEKVTAMLSELVQLLNTRAKARKAAMQEAGYDEAVFSDSLPRICLFIDDLAEFLEFVSEENRLNMERICEKAKGLGVLVFAAGRPADLEKYNELERLTRCILKNQKGLALSGAPSLYTFFSNNLSYLEKGTELKEDEAWLYDQGSCVKIKPAG